VNLELFGLSVGRRRDLALRLMGQEVHFTFFGMEKFIRGDTPLFHFRDFLLGDLLRTWGRQDFLKGGKIREGTKAENLKKCFGRSVNNRTARKVFSAHHPDETLLQ
jgi:hypothetical protein